MSPDAQRIAIAEVCGWNHVHYAKDISESVGRAFFRGQPPGRRDYYDNVPDYLTDLNAMHEAEKVLTGEQLGRYLDYLINQDAVPYSYILATAAQRAEAFLRTLGKWTD